MNLISRSPCLRLAAAIHYNKRSVIDSRKIEENVYFRKIAVALLFKGAYLFHRTSCNSFCLKSMVLNEQRHLQSFQSFLINVLILQYHNSNCSYSISKVNFLEEQL